MPYRIDPDLYCIEPDCRHPRATGELICSQHSRLGRAVGQHPEPEPPDEWADPLDEVAA